MQNYVRWNIERDIESALAPRARVYRTRPVAADAVQVVGLSDAEARRYAGQVARQSSVSVVGFSDDELEGTALNTVRSGLESSCGLYTGRLLGGQS